MEENDICRAIGKLEGKVDSLEIHIMRVSRQLEPLKAFRWKVIGMAGLVSTLVVLFFEVIK